jgi:hypothetical protein
MMRILCQRQVYDDDGGKEQTLSLLFMLKMADLNASCKGFPDCWTPIHALVICHRCVSAYADGKVIVDFLNSGATEYDGLIRCDVAIGDSLHLPSCTALELTRHLMHSLTLQRRPPSEFLQNIESWLLSDVHMAGTIAPGHLAPTKAFRGVKNKLKLSTVAFNEDENLIDFLKCGGMDRERVFEIVQGLQMCDAKDLQALTPENIEEDLGDLDADSKHHLLLSVNEIRNYYKAKRANERLKERFQRLNQSYTKSLNE